MAEAQLRDERGNPIQLTDQYGNPVKLTDEHGNPVNLAGVATPVPSGGSHYASQAADTTGTHNTTSFGTHGGVTGTNTSGFGTYSTGTYGGGATQGTGIGGSTTVGNLMSDRTKQHHTGELHRSNSSSSSSSEDDGEGGRRKKKKGLKEKIKEKIPGVGGERGEGIHYPQNQGRVKTTDTSTYTTTVATGHGQLPNPTTTTSTATAAGKHHDPAHDHHEKKSFMEKIKDKLPGTHH